MYIYSLSKDDESKESSSYYVKKRILVLVHIDLIPPKEIDKSIDISFEPWITEYHVIETLKELKYDVDVLGVYDELSVIREKVNDFKPHVIFNLLEEFDGNVLMDQHIVSFLELLKQNYTGCSPRGLMLSRDKSLTKKILTYHRIATPKFQAFRKLTESKIKKIKLSKKLKFPLIVKCLNEDASLGISSGSVVKSHEKMIERITYLFEKFKADVIVEEFIPGKEVYVGVVGNNRLEVLPMIELHFDNVEKPELEIYSERAKWSKKHRHKKGVRIAVSKQDEELEKKLIKLSKRVFQVLELDGIARIDYRIDDHGNPYVIEANPNPNLAKDDELAVSWIKTGKPYKELIKKLITLSLSR